MRRIAAILATLALGATVLAGAATGDDSHTYYVELDNAFGITNGSEVKVAGVVVGTVTELDINDAKRALLTIELSGDLSQLGQDSICSSTPQSLIAEYSIDCQPRGPALEDGGTIPVEQTTQTVQNDLVANTLREPFKRNFQLILNEFGTAITGNSKSLNQAIRRGAPALREARKILDILGDQNTLLRDLNVNSDTIFQQLAAQRSEINRFIVESADISQATAERKEDLAKDFDLLDDFTAELEPTLVELAKATTEQTPLLRDLRASAAGLDTLATNLPAFNNASAQSLVALGAAAEPGERAFRNGADEISALVDSTKNAAQPAEDLAKFFKDVDDPDRAVEADARAHQDTGRKAPTGYTGLEGLLNYVYYQTGAINQFDQVSHLLHFSLFDVETFPCGGFNAGGEPGTDTFGVPAADGGTTTDLLEAHRCVGWLGDSQPGINSGPEVPPYDPSVCPQGSDAPEVCEPAAVAAAREARKQAAQESTAPSAESPEQPDAADPEAPAPDQPGEGGDTDGGNGGLPDINEALDDILDLPGNVLGGRGDQGDGGGLPGLFGNGRQSSGSGARGLLDFLFGS